jgi:hypothetical protein
VGVVDAQRLQLIAPIGLDQFGTHWRAVDTAHGREVRAHELTGVYVDWRPALPPGHELVEDGGRVFVLWPPPPATAGELPSVPAIGPPPRQASTGLVVGVVVAAVLVVIMLVGGVFVLVRGSGGSGAPVAAPDATNVGLLGVAPGDCIFMSGRAADPTNDVGAQVRQCQIGEGYHRVLSVHSAVPRAEVATIAKSRWEYCAVKADTLLWLMWASADGKVGTMVCAT